MATLKRVHNHHECDRDRPERRDDKTAHRYLTVDASRVVARSLLLLLLPGSRQPKRLWNRTLIERIEIKGGQLAGVELKQPFAGRFLLASSNKLRSHLKARLDNHDLPEIGLGGPDVEIGIAGLQNM